MEGGNSAGSYETKSHLVPLLLKEFNESGTFYIFPKLIDVQYVVLGLITSKFPELEDKIAVIQRIQETSQYVPLEHLCVSTQCGFSSTEEGNILTEEEQWNKIRLVKEAAESVWKDA